MRSALVALLASATIVCARGCDRNNLSERLANLPCAQGHEDAITKCVDGKVNVEDPQRYQECLIAAGCPQEVAKGEATWWTLPCWNEEGGWELQGKEEIKKRQRQDNNDDEEETTKKETTTAKATPKTLTPLTSASTSAKKTTTSPSSAQATTTSSETSTETTTSTTETTPSSTTSTSESTSQSTTIPALSALTTPTPTDGPLICSITSTKSTSQCSISAGRTITCLPTTAIIASCAPGMICFPARKGANSCMRRNNTLTTSGFVVAIAFGVGLTATALAVIALVILGKKKARKDQQAQLLAAADGGGRARGGSEAGMAFARGTARSEADLPLMTSAGPAGGSGYPQQDYSEGRGEGRLTPPEYRGTGASASGAPPVPRLELHQGLGALGQNPRY